MPVTPRAVKAIPVSGCPPGNLPPPRAGEGQGGGRREISLPHVRGRVRVGAVGKSPSPTCGGGSGWGPSLTAADSAVMLTGYQGQGWAARQFRDHRGLPVGARAATGRGGVAPTGSCGDVGSHTGGAASGPNEEPTAAFCDQASGARSQPAAAQPAPAVDGDAVDHQLRAGGACQPAPGASRHCGLTEYTALTDDLGVLSKYEFEPG